MKWRGGRLGTDRGPAWYAAAACSAAAACRFRWARRAAAGSALILLVVVYLLIGGSPAAAAAASASTRARAACGAAPARRATDRERSGRRRRAGGSSSRFVTGEIDETWQRIFARERPDLREADDSSSTTRRPDERLRQRPVVRRALLLPGRQQGLPRPRASSASCQQRFGAPGDFAQAYVRRPRGRPPRPEPARRERRREPGSSRRTRRARTSCSVRLELQADCLAGVWAPLRLRRRASCSRAATSRRASPPRRPSATTGSRSRPAGGVDRESWTHGSSEQREKWFRKGFDSGDPTACDTFEGDV